MNGIGPFRHQPLMSLDITRWCPQRAPADVRRDHPVVLEGIIG